MSMIFLNFYPAIPLGDPELRSYVAFQDDAFCYFYALLFGSRAKRSRIPKPLRAVKRPRFESHFS